MKLRIEDRQKAIDLRRQGLTYNEIRQRIPKLSKGTLSGWLKNVELSDVQKNRILENVETTRHAGQIKGAWANRIKAQKRIEQINVLAIAEFKDLAKDPRFIAGLSLYWAEGAKTSGSFQFINSDPEMIKIMMSWLREVCNLSREEIGVRVYVHKVYSDEKPEEFWSKIVGVPVTDFKRTVYKPTPWTIKRNPSYMGCCRIEVRGSVLFWKVIAWIKEMQRFYFAPVA